MPCLKRYRFNLTERQIFLITQATHEWAKGRFNEKGGRGEAQATMRALSEMNKQVLRAQAKEFQLKSELKIKVRRRNVLPARD